MDDGFSPKIQKTHGLFTRVCPYCGEMETASIENFMQCAEDRQCKECKKKYHAVDNVTVTCLCNPDCSLNNEEHVFVTNAKWGDYERCETCGISRILDKANKLPSGLVEDDFDFYSNVASCTD